MPRRCYDPPALGPATSPLLHSAVVPRPIARVQDRSATAGTTSRRRVLHAEVGR